MRVPPDADCDYDLPSERGGDVVRTKQGLSLVEALKRFSTQWEHYEKAIESGDSSQWQFLGAAWDELRQKLVSGELVATGFQGSAKPTVIDRDAWRVLVTRSHSDLGESTVRSETMVVEGVRVLLPSRAGSKKAEIECRKWIRELASQGYRPENKEALCGKTLQEFPGLTEFAFMKRVWPQEAPDEWKLPGAPKKSAR